jgi:hypothetical protein
MGSSLTFSPGGAVVPFVVLGGGGGGFGFGFGFTRSM